MLRLITDDFPDNEKPYDIMDSAFNVIEGWKEKNPIQTREFFNEWTRILKNHKSNDKILHLNKCFWEISNINTGAAYILIESAFLESEYHKMNNDLKSALNIIQGLVDNVSANLFTTHCIDADYAKQSSRFVVNYINHCFDDFQCTKNDSSISKMTSWCNYLQLVHDIHHNNLDICISVANGAVNAISNFGCLAKDNLNYLKDLEIWGNRLKIIHNRYPEESRILYAELAGSQNALASYNLLINKYEKHLDNYHRWSIRFRKIASNKRLSYDRRLLSVKMSGLLLLLRNHPSDNLLGEVLATCHESPWVHIHETPSAKALLEIVKSIDSHPLKMKNLAQILYNKYCSAMEDWDHFNVQTRTKPKHELYHLWKQRQYLPNWGNGLIDIAKDNLLFDIIEEAINDPWHNADEQIALQQILTEMKEKNRLSEDNSPGSTMTS